MSLTGSCQIYAPYPPAERMSLCCRAAGLPQPHQLIPTSGVVQTHFTLVGPTPREGPSHCGQLLWSKLPPCVSASLAAHGINSASDFWSLRDDAFHNIASSPRLSTCRFALLELRKNHDMDMFTALRLAILLPRPLNVSLADFLLALLPPTPFVVLRRTTSGPRRLQALGGNPQLVCDSIGDLRAGLAVAPSTISTCDSLLKQIHRTCLALGVCPLPASMEIIHRVSSVVGNHTT
jgi:hypothetical protein